MDRSLRNSAAALGSRGGRGGVGASKRRGDSDYYRRLVSLRRDRQADTTGMRHRHLDHQGYTLAAVDDVIANGDWGAWKRLRSALRRAPGLRNKVLRVCEPHAHDPSAQRHRFWRHYAQEDRTAP